MDKSYRDLVMEAKADLKAVSPEELKTRLDGGFDAWARAGLPVARL
jgi:rhodanese-related sulfurtransferase